MKEKMFVFIFVSIFSIPSIGAILLPKEFKCSSLDGQYKLFVDFDKNKPVKISMNVRYRRLKTELLNATRINPVEFKLPVGSGGHSDKGLSFSILFKIVPSEDSRDVSLDGAIMNFYTKGTIEFPYWFGTHYPGGFYIERHTNLDDKTLIGKPVHVACRYDIDLGPEWN
ncbi:MAG: hypothetical protein OXB88_06830 [Bacteriovoracales bacterium]|nr:hypothetical protein [Bacteriovoracales bacterium]